MQCCTHASMHMWRPFPLAIANPNTAATAQSRYNFATEEAVFSYEHTRGTLRLGAVYNFQVPLRSVGLNSSYASLLS